MLPKLALLGLLAQAFVTTPQPATPLLERAAHVAIGAHVVAQFADVASTEWLLGTGRFHEANPLLRWAAKDPIPMAIAKGGLAVGTSYLFLKYHKTHPRLVIIIASAGAGLTSYVAHRNAQLARRLR